MWEPGGRAGWSLTWAETESESAVEMSDINAIRF